MSLHAGSHRTKHRYLFLSPFDDAIRCMKETFLPPEVTVHIPLDRAVGRITAEPIHAPLTFPAVDLAAVDGIAVRSSDTQGAADHTPVTCGDYAFVNTGQVIPPGYDAVIMIEDVVHDSDGCTIRDPAFPGQFIRPAGEDIREGDLILPAGHCIRPCDIGAMATYGITSVFAVSVSIGLIPIGDELVPLGMKPGPGSAVESNTLFAQEYFSGMGATCTRYGITNDDPERITDTLCRAIQENEMVLLFGGSSAGTKDWLEYVISSCGTMLFHGVGMKPGTPVLLGDLEGKPVFGVPGFPVAAACVIREFAGRLLEWWGLPPYPTFAEPARLAQQITSDLGYEEFVQVSAARVGDDISVMHHSRGNGLQMSLVRSNGYIRIPASCEGLDAGEEIQVRLTCPQPHLDRSLLVCGVRDECMHVLGDFLSPRGYFLHCCNTSNTDGLHILNDHRCHAASVAVPGTDTWEGRDIFDAITGRDAVRVAVAEAELGLAHTDGHILDELRGARFVNRPAGTPARVLFDRLLRRRGIDSREIAGYENQCRHEEGVIAAVRTGSADAGVCRRRTAQEAGLDWTPLGYESYELVFPASSLEEPAMIDLMGVLKSEGFRESIRRLGGYRTARTGVIEPLLPLPAR